jgi:ubiquinone/menaquinone biosynthesis C-methylase UbiE
VFREMFRVLKPGGRIRSATSSSTARPAGSEGRHRSLGGWMPVLCWKQSGGSFSRSRGSWTSSCRTEV